MTGIPHLSANEASTHLVAALESAGCAVVTGVLSDEHREAISLELQPYLEQADENAATNRESKYFAEMANFYPGHTKRITALFGKSRTAQSLAMHPEILAACDALLKPNCAAYQLHVGSALLVGPGATLQMLHREEDGYSFFKLPRPNLVLASMWAISDFTSANGATNLVPGSHRWQEGRTAQPSEVVSAEMSAGSVLLWMGGTLHGAGANSSDQWRLGVFFSYSLGWLRQEENQYLDVPPELARTLPKELRDLVGYRMHRGLGFAEPSRARSS